MAAFIIFTVLAAFGGLCILWILFGFLLPGQRGAAAVCLCKGNGSEDAVIRRHLWLYNTGLSRSPLLLVDLGLSQQERQKWSRYAHPIILCTLEELPSLLEQERERLG
jgi:hypothetical protein